MTTLDPRFQDLPLPTPPPPPAKSLKHRLRLWMLRTVGLRYRRKPDKPPANLANLLLIRPDHLGDLLFLTPTLRYLKQALPETRLTLMIGPWGKPVITNNPHVDDVLYCEFPGFTRRQKPSAWQPYRYLSRQAAILRRHQFEAALIPRFDHWWGAWLTAAAHIPYRFGFALPAVNPFLTHALPYHDDCHEVRQNYRLARFAVTGEESSWGEKAEIGDLAFYPAAADEAWANQWLSEQAVAGQTRPVIIHPGAGAAVKLWRVEAWAALINALSRHLGCRVILSGSPGEASLCEEIINYPTTAQPSAAPINMAGQTTLGQLGALMRRAALVIGPDTGPLKLAAAVNTATLQLYGPVDAAKFGPWGNATHHKFITAPLPCLPCNHLDYAPHELAAHYCVRGIGVEAVLTAARELLQHPIK